MSKKLVFLGMGGTIAGTAASASDNVGYRPAQIAVDVLLQAIPGLQEALLGHEGVAEQVAQVDSKDMDFAQWTLLAQRIQHHLTQADVTGVVVTHGTDTLEETAFFLSQVLPAAALKAKPVVLTCAMRPASAVAPDGPQNVLDAVALACTPGAHGVVVVCAGVVYSARDVQKVHPYRLDAFDSGDAGPVAYVEAGVVRRTQAWPEGELQNPAPALEHMAHMAWPRVEIVLSHAGASGAMVRALCAPAAQGDAPLKGIVVAGTGNGSIHHGLDAALREAQVAGVQVVRTTRCAYGRVVAGGLSGDAFAHSQGLPPVKARIALMLQLMA